MPKNFFRSALCLLITILHIHAAAAQTPPDANGASYCSLSVLSMTTTPTTLYILGGSQSWASDMVAWNGPNNVLRTVDISSSFRITDGNVSSYAKTTTLPLNVPRLSRPLWWPTETEEIMMALGKPEPGNRTLWGDTGVASVEKRWWYSVDGGAWREDTADMAFGFSVGAPVSSEANTWVPERQKGYQLGGRTYSVDDQGAVAEGVETGALWVFDKAGDAWSKEDTPFGVVGSAGTGLSWVGVGDDQLIVRFGGVVNRTWASMLEIDIYSTKLSKWYKQSLPADAAHPPPRTEFCTVAVSAADNSSHQILMLGGVEANATGDGTGDTVTTIWALTLPSFDWVLLPSAVLDEAADPGGRISPKCEVIGERYVFQFGGRKAISYDFPTCDVNASAAFLWDINTGTWTDTFLVDNGAYEVSSEVRAVIGGSANGNATKLEPDNGFSDKELGSIFAVTAGSSTPTASPEPTAASTSTNRGAIIGGAVGGTLAFLALSGIGILLFRRRQQRQQPESTLEPKDFIGLNSPTSSDEYYHPRELEVDANSRWEMVCNAEASPVEMPARRSVMELPARGSVLEMPAGYGQEKQVPPEVRRKKVPGR
ncbi:hypothetical protein P167DRAFT_577365 [Morchella conica CCBAS932]|uniref:Galactose oxidase n=1 Tax=Morchella conica CCBAS932 TaxID=1392247 RepID=A0A3N4KLN5_9PEZI|nr:hypothetical protein P167DRAFT_577365 [Morchella conica CCBAS932]